MQYGYSFFKYEMGHKEILWTVLNVKGFNDVWKVLCCVEVWLSAKSPSICGTQGWAPSTEKHMLLSS